MMDIDYYCDFETSMKLRELGFDDKCIYAYIRNPRVKDEMRIKHPGLSHNDFYELLEDFGGPYKWEDVFYISYDREERRARNSHLDGEIGEICSCPSIDQVLAWFAVQKLISVSPKPYVCEDGLKWLVEIRKFSNEIVTLERTITGFDAFYDAITEGVQYVLKEILK